MKASVYLVISTIALSQCLQNVYYVDNGGDQTIPYHMDSTKEKTIESTFLAMLNLKKRPNYIKNPMKKSTLRFLLNIYEMISDEKTKHHIRKRGVENGLYSYLTLEEIHESDMIMAFSVRNIKSLENLKGKVFWIAINKMKGVEKLLRAELRMYKMLGSISSNANDYTIHAFGLNTNDNGRIQLVNSIDVISDFIGWLSVDITLCVQQWISDPNTNHGIYITVTRKSKLQELKLEEIGIVYNDTEEFRPFAVAYVHSRNQIIQRAARDVSMSTPNSFGHLIDLYQSISRMVNGCKRHTMTISFKALNWQDWVVAPESYTAHYCHGECSFPLMKDMNPTNHAIVQSLVNIIDPYRFPKPCCAPTDFNTMSLLYFLDEEHITLQKYNDLLVKNCGCH